MNGSSIFTLTDRPTAEGGGATAAACAGHSRFSNPSYLPPAATHLTCCFCDND